MLSQFTSPPGKRSLRELEILPHDVYPIGRLDEDSEGLLLLTNDNSLKTSLLDPNHGHEREYLAQVERCPDSKKLELLAEGIIIQGRRTKPAHATLVEEEPRLFERSLSIRYRKNVPTAWIRIILTEGKNRQVRRMTAALGHPTLRLIRIRFGTILLGDLAPGEWRALSHDELRRLKRS